MRQYQFRLCPEIIHYSLFIIHYSLNSYAGVAELVALSPHAACGGCSKGEMA
jgi:hypothetical protein